MMPNVHCTLLATAGLFCLLYALAARGAPLLPQHSLDKTLGLRSCAGSLCHGSVDAWKSSGVLQTEYMTWSRTDKHARSYAVLLSERSKEMAAKLGLPAPAHRTGLCLDCHTHNPPPDRRGEAYDVADGVVCESCHGAADRWVKTHVEPAATHAGNVTKGMYPTNDDVARARLCLSCHMGNRNKFVTHKMMAAGHPRLAFELDTFTQIGPAHFQIDADWRKRKGSWEGVRAWAIGQAVAAEELLALLQGGRGRDGLFPELVLFDCHSCHHSMTDTRNTAARVGAGPGVVRLNDSSLLMLRQIARRVMPGEADAFQQGVAELHRAVASGSKAFIQARAVEERIAAMVPRIATYRFSGNDVRAILNGLIDDGLGGQYNDYQGAEQAAMAVQSVVDFMDRHSLQRKQAVQPAMTRMLAAVASDERYQPAAFEQSLRELKASMNPGVRK